METNRQLGEHSTAPPPGDEPTVPTGSLALRAPPALPEAESSGNAVMMLLPMLGTVASIGLLIGTGGGDRTRMWLIGGLFALTSLGFVATQFDRGARQRRGAHDEARGDYLRYLTQMRAQIGQVAERQRVALLWHFPAPSALLVADASLWCRRDRDHPHAGQARFGTTTWPLAVDLLPPDATPVDRTDPVGRSALHRLLQTHRQQPELPAVVELAAFTQVEVCAPRATALSTARSLICSASVAHSPDDLLVAVLCSQARRPDWDWLVWLPHARSPVRHDAIGGRRLVVGSLAELSGLLPDPSPTSPRVLVVIDHPEDGHGQGAFDTPGVATSVQAVRIAERWQDLAPGMLRILSDGSGANVAVAGAEPTAVVLDDCSSAVARSVARRLMGRCAGSDATAPGSRDLGVLAGLGPLATWAGDHRATRDATAGNRQPGNQSSRPAEHLLSTPIGVDDEGRPVWLDLKESALQGMGPHGLVVGATGSGKSEFLRTLVLGLVLTHPSDLLNLVLVDFKGGATFAGLGRLPHCSALITNLAQETELVQRMQDALGGELVRRQEVLRAAGHLTSVHEYTSARDRNPALAPLPHLLVVVDEFSELLTARPEFIDLFVAIGRLGRSLGIHLVLASQRLEEGRLRGLESHLSYRVGLRTFSAAESRAALGVPDAHELPATPGVGLLRTDANTLTRFSTSYVSGPVPRPSPQSTVRMLPLQLDEVALPTATSPDPDPAAETVSLLDSVVARLIGHGPAAHQVWLPPLRDPQTLEALLDPLVASAERGLHSSRGLRAPLAVPIAVVDRPRQQRRDPWLIDLAGAGGHLAVVGGARSGKSNALRAVVTALALTHTPGQATFHLIDLAGHGLGDLAQLPHVGSSSTRRDPDRVRRVLAEVRSLLNRREAWFTEHGVSGPEEYRGLVRAGTGDGHGEVFVVVDNVAALRTDFEDQEAGLTELVTRGLGLGIHLLVSASRWTDLRPAIRDLIGTRIELKLGDPLDSEIDRRTAAAVPAQRPGRGLTPAGEHLLMVAPVDPELVARIDRAWPGQRAPQVPMLPHDIDRSAIADPGRPGGWVLGIEETSGAALVVDLARHEHLIVLGDPGSGRTTTLRGLLQDVVHHQQPEQAQIVLVDPRRTLLGQVPPSHLLEYATHPAAVARVVGGLVETMQRRLPTDEVDPTQLRERTWWQGPEVWVVVDDLDLIANNRGSPLDALEGLLPQAGDVGLHLVVARRTGGAARALFEPLLQGMRDAGACGLLLPGSPDEGVLVRNARARPGVPGRAQWVTGDGVDVVQIARVDPE